MDDILDAVVQAIDEYRVTAPDCPQIDVAGEAIRKEDDWYYVVVTARNRPERSTVYYDHLAAIEKLLEQQGLLVLLVPTLRTFVAGT